MTVDYRTGDVLDQIRQLPDASVDLVATSPPFLALRDYNGQPGQWGSEPDPASFLDHLLELTTELRRVLAPHGSIAIELGDTFSGASGWSSAGDDTWSGGPDRGRQSDWRSRPAKPSGGSGWPLPKSLCGTPTLFAWSLAYGRNLARPRTQLEVVRWVERLRAGGISAESVAWLLSQTRFAAAPDFAPWLVRNVIVWARNNPPVGALGDKVRPATSYITVACPSPRRWFDLDAVRVESPRHMAEVARGKLGKHGQFGADPNRNHNHGNELYANAGNPAGAPPLDHWHEEPDGDLLWLINTQGSSLAHYAMWPPKLVERLILSMCPAQVCRTCGEPRRRITSDRERFTSVQPEIAAHIRACRERAGLTSDELNQRLGYREIAKNWERTDPHGAAIPNPADWLKLKELIGVGDGFDAVVLGDRRWHESHMEYVDGAGRPADGQVWQSGMAVGMGAHSLKGKSLTARAPSAWSDCGHDNYRPGHVLDTFAGTGTTLAVADILGRDATGIDLDPANPALYPARWAQCWKALRADAGPPPITPAGQQLGLAI